MTFVITAPPTKLPETPEKIGTIRGIIDVHEMLTARRNIHVDIVETSTFDITRITDAIHNHGTEISISETM